MSIQETAVSCLALADRGLVRAARGLTPAERAKLFADGVLSMQPAETRTADTLSRGKATNYSRCRAAAEEFLALPADKQLGAIKEIAYRHRLQYGSVQQAVKFLRRQQERERVAA